MRSDEDQIILERAAAGVRRRILRDAGRSSPRIQPMLAHIARHLLDRRLTVDRTCRACGIRDHSSLTRFREEVGKTPYAYIIDRRMAVAAALLERSDLKIWKISLLVGYSTLPAFSDAFLRWSGQRPRVYRASWRTRSRARARVSAETFLESVELPEGRSREGAETDLPVMVDGEAFEKRAAAEIWDRIREAPQAERLHAVRRLVVFRSPALFEVLQTESLEKGRGDPEEGRRLAELALASLDSYRPASDTGERTPCTRADRLMPRPLGMERARSAGIGPGRKREDEDSR